MKVVFVDHYDSFAQTIAGYFRNAGAEVAMYTSDCSIQTIEKMKPDLIVLGPGPNGPADSGNYLAVIDHFYKTVPIFGICLGFQTIMHFFGEKIGQLKEPIHGDATSVSHDRRGIFSGIENKTPFARYHSLGCHTVPAVFKKTAASDGIVMAASHRKLPIAGIQFHPESILSMENNAGKKLIENVLRYVR